MYSVSLASLNGDKSTLFKVGGFIKTLQIEVLRKFKPSDFWTRISQKCGCRNFISIAKQYEPQNFE